MARAAALAPLHPWAARWDRPRASWRWCAPTYGTRDNGSVTAHILIVDNYDSFVFNIAQYLAQLGAQVDVHRNDEVSAAQALDYDGVLISPGPGDPHEAGVSMEMVLACAGQIPLFGVCLGHQAIGAVFGGVVSRAPELLHGKTSLVHHKGAGVLAGLPDPFRATRYHSLAVERDSVPDELEVTGWTDSGVVMALRHRAVDIEGVQFHPESVLTEGGHLMLANWLVRCGDDQAVQRAQGLSPVVAGSGTPA